MEVLENNHVWRVAFRYVGDEFSLQKEQVALQLLGAMVNSRVLITKINLPPTACEENKIRYPEICQYLVLDKCIKEQGCLGVSSEWESSRRTGQAASGGPDAPGNVNA